MLELRSSLTSVLCAPEPTGLADTRVKPLLFGLLDLIGNGHVQKHLDSKQSNLLSAEKQCFCVLSDYLNTSSWGEC